MDQIVMYQKGLHKVFRGTQIPINCSAVPLGLQGYITYNEQKTQKRPGLAVETLKICQSLFLLDKEVDLQDILILLRLTFPLLIKKIEAS